MYLFQIKDNVSDDMLELKVMRSRLEDRGYTDQKIVNISSHKGLSIRMEQSGKYQHR